MKSKSLSATFLKAFTFTFILAQANPAFSAAGSEAAVDRGQTSVSSGASGAAGVDTGGIPGAKEKIRTEVSNLLAWNADVTAVPATGGIPNIGEIQAAFTKYDTNSEPCISAQANASLVCLEKTSPKLQETLNAVNVIVSGLSAASVADSCSTIGKALNIAKLGLTAYTATCGALRATCEYVCSSASGALTELKAAVAAAVPTCIPAIPVQGAATCSTLMGKVGGIKSALIAAIEPELVAENPKSIAGKSKLCTYSYADLILSAGAGILSTIQSMKSANKCKEDTSATNPTAVPTDLAVKCAMEQYKATEECICYLNPRTTGCANSLEKTNSTSDGSIGTAAIDASTPRAKSMSGLGPDSDAQSPNTGSGSDGGALPGSPSGGSAGIGGGGGDGMGGRGPNSAGSGLNTDILSGSGGGGGGGAWGRGGSSSANGKYRDYLPGGNKDPKSLGGQAPWTKEVTGQGGKSNWEKVRDRYRDNKSSLINN